ncbi:uncharacterized protein A4U43_C05F32660 [Asparagus officinalis]|uniref:Uncharacterized protein n=1 Tax=Asparagus officinalis TaxID=4686 RepID=A0A5P1EWW3_ASPOF|nr:uncharacterized protein A4U43_C05F32660 [Asparagus officinalis]
MTNGNDNAEIYFYLNDLEIEEIEMGDEDWMSTVTEENETEEDRILEINIIEEDSKEQSLAEEIPELEEADESMEEDPAGTVINYWPVSYIAHGVGVGSFWTSVI